MISSNFDAIGFPCKFRLLFNNAGIFEVGPQYEDIILDYLHKERESGLNYFMYMLYLYVISTITTICYYKTCMKKDVKHQYGGLEEDSSRLRGSA